jgi:catechol 2,3-dioxygenase-like lactoylglutathione lyase family enzyme/predicted enzyme related to lactoylglutathione lyase
MVPSPVSSLRSGALGVTDLAAAEKFFVEVWRLSVSDRAEGVVYLRAAGRDHHVVSLHRSDKTALRNVTLRTASLADLQRIEAATKAASGTIVSPIGPVPEPCGGRGLTVRDPHGRLIRIVEGDRLVAEAADSGDRPMRLAHVVLNSRDVPASQKFLESVLGFRLIDRTRIMAFMNCNSDHHTIAFADADNDALNHVAFLMPDLESVMRGGGRLKDAGFPIEWGPGRHGPGNNAFNYFVGPEGIVVEYTAEVEQVDDRYAVGTPEKWGWPKGRTDHWGISAPPSARLKEAQRLVFFA